MTRFKTVRGAPEGVPAAKADNIMVRRAGMLQMVSEPVVGRCASEDAGPPRGVDWAAPEGVSGAKADNIMVRRAGILQMVSEPVVGRCASEDAGPPRGVDCKIPHRWGGELSTVL
ncbi:hypothetical protein QVD17_30627 [Tagetes erecta]|uniref:Uncharacterized protein n=1 Tax=Tagetes erecta TaxID=13708 RepID=A0AAD8K5L8_TARER|nr:hypothetical protein QVD17_30627 [Tagetes erecta]